MIRIIRSKEGAKGERNVSKPIRGTQNARSEGDGSPHEDFGTLPANLRTRRKSDIGLATVYRVLTQFETAGILVRHHFDSGRATYELAEGQHHDHIVCMRCGRVEEFVDVDIERMQRNVAKKYGYDLCDHSLILYGICEECRKEEELKNEKQ